MKYRIVPVEIDHELPEWGSADTSQSYWETCLSAAPKASEAPEAVEVVAQTIRRNCVGVEQCDAIARAVLRALEGGGE